MVLRIPRSFLLFVACVLAAPLAGAQEPAALTLHDCFQLALKRSEEIAIHQELIKETEGRFLQALSGALPRASFNSSNKRQDAAGDSPFRLRDVPERKFTFSQPLFSGFKEFAAMAGSRAERRQRIQEKVRAEQLLFVDVSDAFYSLLEHREDGAALTTIREALVERLRELKGREELGRSRPSETASAEARLRRIEAEMEQVRSEELVTRQLLEFLTGLSPLRPLAGAELRLPLEPEGYYLAKTADRADVRAAEEAWRVESKEVAVARAAVWPTVSADGNYYTKRVGVSEQVEWDATLTVDVPIFQGGQAVGAIEEASSEARQARLRFEQTSRQALLDIRDAYAQMQAALARRDALEQALAAADRNYLLQIEDYRLNLVSNLDVLQTLQDLQDARRDFLHAQHEAKRQYWRLRAAAGDL
ncbi:MAG: TolC family protein [Candidatus Omnitrophica bacterium]|nr:TolC family protein [Candidatus Omnitrophota bacterium]